MKKLAAILLIALASCELIVEVDVPYEGDKIVLNAIQSADSTWSIELTRSQYIITNIHQPGFNPIFSAQVSVYGDDGSITALQAAQPGYFTSNTRPVEGVKYKIEVSANGFTGVEAEMTIPYSVKIKNVAWDSTDIDTNPNPDYFFGEIPVEVTFDDPGDVKNYYSIIVATHSTVVRQFPGEPQPRTDSLITYREAIIVDPAISTEDNAKQRFSDETFNGKTYTASLRVYQQYSPNFRVHRTDLLLVSLSEECYRYEESRSLYNDTEGDPFAQPVQVYTNVLNGLGVFGGASQDSRTWRVKP